MNCLVFEVSRKRFVSAGHSSKHDAPISVLLAQRRVEAGESRTGGRARLPLRFETGLGYARVGLKFKKIKIERRTK